MTSANIPDMALTVTTEQRLKELAQAVVERPWSFACQDALSNFLQEDLPCAREAAHRILAAEGIPAAIQTSRTAEASCTRPASGGRAQGDVAPSRPASTVLHNGEGTSCSDC